MEHVEILFCLNLKMYSSGFPSSQRKLKEGITTGRAKEGVKESNLDSRSSKMWPTFQYLSNFLRPEVECLLQSLNMSISTEMINRFPHT